MIRMLVKLGHWLETRFPEKVTLALSDYEGLKNKLSGQDAELGLLRAKLDMLEANIEPIVSRLSVVEVNAVHKGAVQDVLTAVDALKNEYVSLKASLGMAVIQDKGIKALLNGYPTEGE